VHNWVKWPEHESGHKPLYNVEITSGAMLLSLYMSVPSISMAAVQHIRCVCTVGSLNGRNTDGAPSDKG
jgi:hypothetical protein